MRRWLDFAGGLLVGFGLAAYAFLALLLYAIQLRHMFIIGVTRPFAAVFFFSLPAFAILMGVAVMTVRRRSA